MTNNESLSQRTLQFRRVFAIGRVTRERLTDRSTNDHVYDQLLIRLETAILAEQIKSGTYTGETVHIPITWWDHWKQDHAPAWFVRKWPVHYRQVALSVDLTRWARYPAANLPLPNKNLGPIVIVDELEPHTTWS